MANPYLWSSWFLDNIPGLQTARKEAEELKAKGSNDGVQVISKDGQWLLYLNLLKGDADPHSLALEEKVNPSLRNWDDFMIDKERVGKYKILHAIQDFYFCEVGVRKVNKRYCLLHFTKNSKETSAELVNFCWDKEELAKSKLKNSVIRDKNSLIMKWIKLLKNGMLFFVDYRSRDWFLEQLKVKHG